MNSNPNLEDPMNTKYALPATLAVTMHAFVLFGLPGDPPPAAGPEAPLPKDDPLPPYLIYESPPPALADAEDWDRTASEKTMAPRGDDVPLIAPPGDRFFIPPLLRVDGTGPITTIPTTWARPETGSGWNHSEVVDLTKLDRVPRARVQPAPDYPYEPRYRGIESTVVVQFLVDEAGNVYNPIVLSATAPGFEEAVLRAVARWKFEPGTRNNRRVRFRMSVPVVFHLGED
jgi:protein TonB